MSRNGKLIVLEGSDGSGKTTQVSLLMEYLASKNIPAVRVRDPGGTLVGDKIREILLNDDMGSVTELALFTASRLELIKEVILPALEEGKVVVSDRFTDSTMAYQGYGRQLVRQASLMVDLVHEIVIPDHVLFLDVPLQVSIDRINERAIIQGKDRLDSLDIETKKRIYQGFIAQRNLNKERNVVINANCSIDETFTSIAHWVDNNLIKKGINHD